MSYRQLGARLNISQKWLPLLLFAAILNFSNISRAEIYTNPLTLREAVFAEEKLVEEIWKLEERLADVESSANLTILLNNYVDGHFLFEADLGRPLSETDRNDVDDDLLNKVVGSPLQMFKFAKRATKDLENVVAQAKEQLLLSTDQTLTQSLTSFLDFVEKLQSPSVAPWPDHSDLTGIMMSLTRIQYIYNFSPKEYSEGRILDSQSHAHLSIEDLALIAASRMEVGGMTREIHGPALATAVEFQEAAYELYQDTYPSEYPWLNDIREKLVEYRAKHDAKFIAPATGDGPSDWPDELSLLERLGKDLKKTARSLREREERIFTQERSSAPRLKAKPEDWANFYGRDYTFLCRGLELRRKLKEKRPRICYYTNKGDPYLKIQPLKVEVLLEEPRSVYVYHDVITDRTSKELKVLASKEMNRGAVSPPPGTPFYPFLRTQSMSWVYDQAHPNMDRLSRYLDHVTGLKVSRQSELSKSNRDRIVEAEAYQVGLYSPGGIYSPHEDTLVHDMNLESVNGVWVGNRIATAMFYLNDIAQGGKTVFPNMGVSVTPVKGSMVLWYGLLSGGAGDELSLHAGCPTAYGIKWVSNKWIREGCQVFTKPCLPEGPNQPLKQ